MLIDISTAKACMQYSFPNRRALHYATESVWPFVELFQQDEIIPLFLF